MSDDDPFEELDDAVGDREGDPFESLDADDSVDDETQSGEDGSAEKDQFVPDHDPSTGTPGASDTSAAPTSSSDSDGGADTSEMGLDVGRRDDSGPGEDPFSDVGDREGDPFDSFEDTFEEMDVDKLDPDEVWQDLASAESRGSVGSARQRTYAEVSKHSYCEQCEYFSPPPDVSCGHEGTDIVEFLDMETVRVVDCPIVTEREELEASDGFADK
ncbi:hypothetical protein [Halovenus halobia]|uniref:hypothetical protein n=1 Tax=Halovenus halobia TaxID=3396622 RepID=UPI003F578992